MDISTCKFCTVFLNKSAVFSHRIWICVFAISCDHMTPQEFMLKWWDGLYSYHRMSLKFPTLKIKGKKYRNVFVDFLPCHSPSVCNKKTLLIPCKATTCDDLWKPQTWVDSAAAMVISEQIHCITSACQLMIHPVCIYSWSRVSFV